MVLRVLVQTAIPACERFRAMYTCILSIVTTMVLRVCQPDCNPPSEDGIKRAHLFWLVYVAIAQAVTWAHAAVPLHTYMCHSCCLSPLNQPQRMQENHLDI